ncbi:MAG: efflux RND transporter periplasmic adaptor subunit [Phycisphaerales bacterium]
MSAHSALPLILIAGIPLWALAAPQPPSPGVGSAPAGTLKAATAPEYRSASEEWRARHLRFGGTEWLTRAKQDAPLGFTLAVEVVEIIAKGGTAVKAGDLLVRGRDGEVLAAVAAQRARADNETEVTSAEAQAALAQTRFDAVVEAKVQGVHNKAEFDEREAQLTVAKIAIDAARNRLKEERLRATQLEEQAKRYRVEAPFDGMVDQVVCELGQSVNENQPIMRLVDISALYIDVPIKTTETILLNLGASKPAWVLLDLPGDPVVLDGRILYVSPAADASSGTRRVRIELANPKLLPPGTNASVRFTMPPTDWNNPQSAAAGGSERAPK